ncbi:HupK protein [Paraburkholderia dinghuensis]|uniref:HupK protein n=1 Tax=Paraburkholderia dinghuensis TaxID=2305225 RepID=A0A3N6MSW1_9BURK|nr:HupK protein [Paraburkholderia dinghuensis]RQH07064.1 HupK protein [Paraburkholderia dinghuensis]
MTLLQVPVLTLTLRGDAECVHTVASQWSPLPVERLLTGRGAAEVPALLSTTLVLCRHAQCAASAHALAAALEAPSPDAADPEPIELEAARETLRRWLIDFPAVFGGAWAKDEIAQWARLDSRAHIADFCEQHVFGMSAAAWLTRPEFDLANWAASAGTLPARWLHGLLERAERPVSVMPANVLRNVHENAETVLLARDADVTATSGSGWPAHADLWDAPGRGPDLASALLTSRLQHLARLCANRASRVTGGLRRGDIGIGWAYCARGLLVHLARVEDGRIAAYRIVPPTRWNLGRTSLLPDALRGLRWSAAQPLAQRLALLLDPCAPYRIEVDRHA